MKRAICKVTMSVALCAGLLGMFATPAAAQVAVTGGLDFTNQYMFRGIRQNYAGMSIWPFVDLGGSVFKGDGGLKSVNVNIGSWNAINTDQFGSSVSEEPKFYESDFYATLGFGFNKAAVGFTYTAYMSPAENIGDTPVYFKTVHELAVKMSFDDSGALGKGALKPYALVAFELGDGGADGVSEKGTYVELGIAPGYSGAKASVAIPVKIGLSANNYYEFGGEDSTFGYFSVAGIATVPINSNWNVHGGLELQVFGDKLRSLNAFGDSLDRRYAPIGSIGIGFSY
jgi:hypothetical protein